MGLILPQKVEVKITSNVKHFVELGYDIPVCKIKYPRKGKLWRYDTTKSIFVNVLDLQPHSNILVQCSCDYCGKIIHKTYCSYVSNMKGPVPKVACIDCRIKKVEELNKLKYNVSFVFELDDVKQKIRKTLVDKYGVEHPAQDKNILQKMSNTVQKRYGVNYAGSSKILRQRQVKSLYKNCTQATSAQQKYICTLFNGELNYPIFELSCDIILLNDKIEIEYDGGGHNLSVKIGDMSQQEFDNHEIMRNNIIRRAGYKQIHIISRKDKLPSDEVLLQMLADAKHYFATTKHTWRNYDIDENKYYDAEHKDGVLYNYGVLRKIKKEELA